MVIRHLAGKRMQGTDAERLALTTAGGQVTTGGGWKELKRLELGSATKNFTIDDLPDKQYYMVLWDMNVSNNGNTNGNAESNCFRFRDSGGDMTGHNSNARYHHLSGTVSGNGSYTYGYEDDVNRTWSHFWGFHPARGAGNERRRQFAYQLVANKSGVPAMAITHATGSSRNNMNSGGYVEFCESTQSAPSTNTITGLSLNSNTGWVGSWTAGSECVVLGWDPDDTHTDNFWEKLGEGTISSDGDIIETTGFAKKKYLWVQAYLEASADNTIEADLTCYCDGTHENTNQIYTYSRGKDQELYSTFGSNNLQSSANALRINRGGLRFMHLNMFILNRTQADDGTAGNDEQCKRNFIWTIGGNDYSNASSNYAEIIQGAGMLDDYRQGQIDGLRFTQVNSSIDFDANSKFIVWGAD